MASQAQSGNPSVGATEEESKRGDVFVKHVTALSGKAILIPLFDVTADRNDDIVRIRSECEMARLLRHADKGTNAQKLEVKDFLQRAKDVVSRSYMAAKVEANGDLEQYKGKAMHACELFCEINEIEKMNNN